ncbi:MAG TPA: hypothetical protein VEQ36_04935, partial [Thermomicrobiales bacterium]|nr:hypothetical protein [Thermomicrobiales bacterium]
WRTQRPAMQPAAWQVDLQKCFWPQAAQKEALQFEHQPNGSARATPQSAQIGLSGIPAIARSINPL